MRPAVGVVSSYGGVSQSYVRGVMQAGSERRPLDIDSPVETGRAQVTGSNGHEIDQHVSNTLARVDIDGDGRVTAVKVVLV